MTGADLTKLPGLDLLAVERILSEIGLDMSRWPSEKHFCAWLNVAPNNRISGGRILSSKPRKNANRAAAALRLAARSAMQSKSAIGAFIRRIVLFAALLCLDPQDLLDYLAQVAREFRTGSV